MFSFSLPSEATAAVQSMSPMEIGWTSSVDDVALGCECADPALQIAMWRQEADEPGPAAGTTS